MPEGPTIVILKEEVQAFAGQKIISVSGNSQIDQTRLYNRTVTAFKSWGKHFLICFDGFSLRIHFLLFGSYRINERKDAPARLSLTFPDGELNLYSCSIKYLEGDINTHYDWSVDVMNPDWDPAKARRSIAAASAKMICDTLLEQDIFAGVGNIIKNEVLYRVYVHPESLTGKLPEMKIMEIIAQARLYSFEFLAWKKQYELKQHWLVHTKKICIRCHLSLFRKNTGVKKRRSFFCENCQISYQ
ncbi:MAG TPA: DNA-formamidopyrimidine glycosylase family protein [Burkholderiales bacterium]|nr:DNA-formamidopyrimidine glycosylase family protein [Burkholderiales bacterium]